MSYMDAVYSGERARRVKESQENYLAFVRAKVAQKSDADLAELYLSRWNNFTLWTEEAGAELERRIRAEIERDAEAADEIQREIAGSYLRGEAEAALREGTEAEFRQQMLRDLGFIEGGAA